MFHAPTLRSALERIEAQRPTTTEYLQQKLVPVDGGELAPPGGTPPMPLPADAPPRVDASTLTAMAAELQKLPHGERMVAATDMLATVNNLAQQGVITGEQAGNFAETFGQMARDSAAAAATGGSGGDGRQPPGPPTKKGDPDWTPGNDARITYNGEKRMAGMRLRDILGWSAASAGGIAGAAGLYDMLMPDELAVKGGF